MARNSAAVSAQDGGAVAPDQPGNQPGQEWWPFVVGVARAGKTQEPIEVPPTSGNLRYEDCGSQAKCLTTVEVRGVRRGKNREEAEKIAVANHREKAVAGVY